MLLEFYKGACCMKKTIKISLIFLIVVIIIIFSAFNNNLKTVNYNIKTDKVSNSIKLAVVSDLHCCLYGGGQFRIPFIGGLFAPGQGLFPKLTSGRHTKSGTDMIISRGIGNSSFPVRINNHPELVVVELKR